MGGRSSTGVYACIYRIINGGRDTQSESKVIDAHVLIVDGHVAVRAGLTVKDWHRFNGGAAANLLYPRNRVSSIGSGVHFIYGAQNLVPRSILRFARCREMALGWREEGEFIQLFIDGFEAAGGHVTGDFASKVTFAWAPGAAEFPNVLATARPAAAWWRTVSATERVDRLLRFRRGLIDRLDELVVTVRPQGQQAAARRDQRSYRILSVGTTAYDHGDDHARFLL